MKKLTRHQWISVLFFVCFTALIVLLARGLMINPNKVPSALLGKKAQSFQVKTIQDHSSIPGINQQISLAKLTGKPIILNFWASWCHSCREEAIELEKFWRRYQSDLIVVGIAVQDTIEDAQKFAQHFGKTYPLGLDESGQAAIDYGVHGVPETFFIDAQGIIRHKEQGPVTVAMAERFLGQLIR